MIVKGRYISYKGQVLLSLGVWVFLFLSPLTLRAENLIEAPITIDRLPVNLAIRLPNTLFEDFAIRITNRGFAFLARQIQWLLMSWVRRDRLSLDAPGTVSALLANSLIGMKSGGNASGVNYCLFIHNTNDDDQEGQICRCPSTTPSGGSDMNDWNTDDCTPCWPGNSGNPTPSGPWNVYGPNWDGCNSQNTTGTRLAYMRNPANPDDNTFYYWCKGPFYDTPLQFNVYRADPDCFRRDTFSPPSGSDPCPNIGTGQTCGDADGDGDYCDPEIGADNDVVVNLVPNPASSRLDLTLTLVNIHFDAWADAEVSGCHCCLKKNPYGGPAGTAFGSLVDPISVVISGLIQFVNGYYKMRGKDGQVSSSGSTTSGSTTSGSTSGGSSGSKGTCFPSSSGSSTGSSTSTSTSGSPVLNHHALVGMEAVISSVNIPGSININCGGISACKDYGWLCSLGCGFASVLCSILQPIIRGLITSAVEGLLRDMLNDEVQSLLDEELGLPLDFVMLLSGVGSPLAKDICALRLPSGHPLGLTCSHTTGNCPCDDYDNDGVLNYQDPTPGITPSGCAAGTWCGAWTNSLEMWYSWWWGLASPVGGYRGSRPPVFEVGAYVDDVWDSRGANLVVDFAMVPYKTPNAASTLSGHPRQGYYPDPQASGGQGQWWSDAFPQRSCYPVANLWLDPTQRDNDLSSFIQAPPSSLADPLLPAFHAYLDDFDYQVGKAANRPNHYNFLISQQFLQEFFNAIYVSGLLCLDITRDQFPFLEDILKVSNFKAFLPFLSDVDASGNPKWKQDGYVGLRLIPTDAPLVRTLGRRAGCFPSGDVIPPANILNTHGQLQLHVPASSCSPAPAPSTNNVYDLLVYLPHYQIEVTAPNAAGSPQVLFRIDWDVGLALAVEYTVGARNTTWEGNVPRFFEILMDLFLGCGGTLFGGQWSGLNFTWYGPPTCGITNINASIVPPTKSIGGVIHTILNAAFSFLLKTRIFLGGLNIDFYKVGSAYPTEGGSPTASQLDTDCTFFGAGDYGCGNPDYFAMAGEFVGTVDFAALLAILGGIRLAPGLDVLAETYVGLPDEVIALLGGKGQLTSGRIELSPRESYLAGFGRGEGRIRLEGSLSFLPAENIRDTLRFTYRLDGGAWHPYRPGDLWVEPLALPTGRHVLEVRAKGPYDIGDLTPAEVVFYVDDVPPELKVYDREGRYLPLGVVARTTGLKVVAEDNLSEPQALRVRYRVDGDRYQELRRGWIDLSSLKEGYHRVEILAEDEFGLTTSRIVEVSLPASSDRWGCTFLPSAHRDLQAAVLYLFSTLLSLLLPLLAWKGLRRSKTPPLLF